MLVGTGRPVHVEARLMRATLWATVAAFVLPGGGLAARVPISAGFASPCVAYTTGTIDTGPTIEGCSTAPLLFSVTQETPDGDHNGSLNWIGPDTAYMADYKYPTDLGTWLFMGISEGVVTLRETIVSGTNLATGWPLAYGHTFIGLNDLSIRSDATLDRGIEIGLDVRIGALPTAAPGARALLGGVIEWPEAPPRTNTQHYLEVVLAETPGYGPTLGGQENTPGCDDAPYESCFFDPTGNYPEGRYVYYNWLGYPPIPLGQWSSIGVAYGSLAKALRWASPPARWSDARLTGLYLAVEGMGYQHTVLRARGWNPTMRAP